MNTPDIQKSNTLTPEEKSEVRALLAAVNAHDGQDDDVFLSNDVNFDKEAPCFYRIYADGVLAAFLTTFMPTHSETELTAFTHPTYRRRGFFAALCAAALEDAAALGIKSAQLAVNNRSTTGNAVLQGFAARQFNRSEYRFVCTRYAATWQDTLRWCAVTEQTAAAYRQVIESCFPELEHDLSLTQALLTEPTRRGAIGFDGDTPVAVYALQDRKDDVFIYGVAVDAARHNRGYGKQLLAHAVPQALAVCGRAVLDVDSANPAALHLYTQAGFENEFQMDYWSIPVPKTE